jgi:16S rRNA C1402 N4-methylase RsmH
MAFLVGSSSLLISFHSNNDTTLQSFMKHLPMAVANSEENLPLDAQMQITIGSIAIPRGSGTLAITKLTGPQNFICYPSPY